MSIVSPSTPLLPPELLVQLERLELVSRKIFRGRLKGERRSRRKGQSVEFADFRNYVAGDDLRFIDWNMYARLDRLFLKMYLEEEDLHFFALIDASTSMDFGDPTKLQYAKQLAAALGFIGLCRADRVRLETLGQALRAPSPVLRGRHSVWRMTEYLQQVQPGENISLADGVRNFCLRNSGKGILILITDLMDKQGYESALRYLLAQNLDVYLIHVLSPAEVDPDIVGDLRLVDSEDADVAEITVSRPLMERYRRTLSAFVEDAPRVLQPSRDFLSAGQYQHPRSVLSDQLSATARPGSVMGLFERFAATLTRSYGTLAGWQWLVVLAIPPSIVLLYFLKLKRQPLEVPSTYLWHRTIEDLHVNSLWQRLRQNLLLFLQLLLLLLAILALLRPSWQGSQLSEDRYIFLMDTSASMSATDIQPTRLENAKQQLLELIDQQLKPGSAAMIISFSDRAIVEQPFTDNRRLLKRRVNAIQATQRPSDLDEALRVAAGLANPGRTASDATDVAAADALPAGLMIFSDGRYRTEPKFAMGNLKPTYIPLGDPAAENVGIVAFSAGNNPDHPEKTQLFGRLQNFGSQEVTVSADLILLNPNRHLLDAVQVRVPPGGIGGVEFTIDTFDEGELRLELDHPDALAIDNIAYVAIDPRERARVLVATPHNDALETVLATAFARKLADIEIVNAAYLQTEEYRTRANSGALDLIIYDQCQPPEMPRSNTYFIGQLPVDQRWSAAPLQQLPQIIDSDRAHPIMRFVELGDLKWIVESQPLDLPLGGTVLIESHVGVLLGIAPREGFEDLVQAFPIVSVNEKGERFANTDWPIRVSFPVFIGNVLSYLGGSSLETNETFVQPGQTVTLRTSEPVDEVTVRSPTGQQSIVPRGPSNTFVYGQTEQTGVYQVGSARSEQVNQRFAVNLFDVTESNVRPQEMVKTEFEDIQGSAAWETKRHEAWKYLLLAALVVLLVEWYIYNQRVYI